MTGRSVEHATIVIERRYDAPPGRVFAAWADPDARSQWDVPGEGWAMTDAKRDFRVGGHEFSRIGPVGDPQYACNTRYEDIVPDRRIVFAYTMDHRDVRITASLATVELLPEGEATHLIMTEQAVFLDGYDKPAFREEGWSSMLDKLGVALHRAAVDVDR